MFKLCKFCNNSFDVSDSNHWKIGSKGNYECKIKNRETARKVRGKNNLKKYGVENPLKSKDYYQKLALKRKNTMVKKYGVNNPMQVAEFKERKKKTSLERFGAEHHMMNKEISDIVQIKSGLSSEVKNRLLEKARGVISDKYKAMLSIGISLQEYCNTNGISKTWAYNIYKTQGELALFDSVQDYRSKISDLSGQFISMFRDIPDISIYSNKPIYELSETPDFTVKNGDKEVYVNLHSLYWNSKIHVNSPDIYMETLKNFKSKNKDLLFFRANELAKNPSVVRSIILNSLGYLSNPTMRGCRVEDLSPDRAELFLNQYCLGGYYKATTSFGVLSKNNLKAVASVRFRYKTVYIERLCAEDIDNSAFYFGKLLDELVKVYKPKMIVYYSDLRYDNFVTYCSDLGFEKVKENPDWVWTNGVDVLNKTACTSNMDGRFLKEASYAAEMGLSRIYDAGKAKYIKMIKDK